MSITKCPGHMRSLKLNFSSTVLTLGLKAKIFENLRLCQAKFWGELRTRATFYRCVLCARVKAVRCSVKPAIPRKKTWIPANIVFFFAVVISSTNGRGRLPQIPEGEGGLVKRTKKT